MINEGANILVIASIDGTALAPILQTAADQGIKVIAYDRLINGTDNVDYYATFDNYQVGKFQGEYIETALDLKNRPARSTSSPSPVRLTTTTRSSSSPVPGTCCSRTSRRAS